ncbi:M23 family metallopeptidase [Streptomyces sp. WMMC897]|uniref:M23 family metallopeptidase n=1 Tax=Streptomyces sp. WMMC897 TaxID=3014782 RepID=UPI0022B62D1D|nr:M23 family metallopeptidase [Streptomyces sp. WMMC897]MCZ7417096.1 M23 family metallopeptidase [Streptomyces sp. WMMC897]
MNDRPPSDLTTPVGSGFSEHSPHTGYAGYEDPYGQAAGYGGSVTDTTSGYQQADPLFGALPGDGHGTMGYPGYGEQPAGVADHHGYEQADNPFGGSAYDGSTYGTGGHGTDFATGYGTDGYGVGIDANSFHSSDPGINSFSQAVGYDTGGLSSGAYDTGGTHDGSRAVYGLGTADPWGAVDQPLHSVPPQPDHAWADGEGVTWNASAYSPEPADAGTAEAMAGPEGDEGVQRPHDAWDPAGPAEDHDGDGGHLGDGGYTEDGAYTDDSAYAEGRGYPEDGAYAEGPAYAEDAAPAAEPEEAVASTRAGRRRAAKPKRSALLTVAVPSVAVMGVAGISAASVSGVADTPEENPAQAAPDTGSAEAVAVNNKLDTQLAGLSADARDFGDRASRTQERIDLKAREEAARKRKAEEAARREALRPKFALPVDQRGLSAYFGQAGLNWISVHTGVDFPVGYGTPVKAATDGTITTKWDFAYGNMIILTAPDGTETWYCHLSSTRIRSGQVKAGDTIGYAGNSGNSTGPHLHFEVRPGGGSAVDPVAWFRAKGLDPT